MGFYALYNTIVGIIVVTIIIVLTTIDLFKVLSSKSMDELPEVKKRFVRRLICGIFIHFIPQIVIFIFKDLI